MRETGLDPQKKQGVEVLGRIVAEEIAQALIGVLIQNGFQGGDRHRACLIPGKIAREDGEEAVGLGTFSDLFVHACGPS